MLDFTHAPLPQYAQAAAAFALTPLAFKCRKRKRGRFLCRTTIALTRRRTWASMTPNPWTASERNIFNFYGLIKIALALEEARAGEIDPALVTLDHSLASNERTGQRCFEAETHRIRGEILLKQN